MPNDYGWCWILNQQRVICDVRDIKRGSNKGLCEVTLCRGRDAKGNIIPGKKYIVTPDNIIELPLLEGE